MGSNLDERILVLAPVGRDAGLAQAALDKVHIPAHICANMDDLQQALRVGAGAVLLTQEALSADAMDGLLESLESQPPWSDTPLIVLVSGGMPAPALTHLTDKLGQQANATFLDRPVRATTLVNTAQVALRARRRQYELREHLTARASAEEAERESRLAAEDAIRIRDEFLAAVAHDLKNPLGAIKGYAQLLKRQTTRTGVADTAKLVQGLETIDAMVAKAVDQIDELLDLARIQADQPLPLNLAPVDLVDLTRRIVSEHQQALTRHHIRFVHATSEVVGVWDLPRLERVLGNLLSNAVKYSPEQSEIFVEVRLDDALDGSAVLIVRDQGIGVPSADLPHLFERFYRASNATGHAGTGLGLAGVRQIVEQHGGAITVESEEGRGSCFTVRLPVVRTGADVSARPR